MSAQTNTSKVSGFGKFIKSVRAELKKVSWPNKQELQSYTIVVLVTCALASIAIWLADSFFGLGLKFMIK